MLLAVSGGLDSMVMLDLFVKAGFTVAVAHCNFKLRDADADDDEQFVREKAQALNVPFHTTSFDTKEYAAQQRISIQMAARELRYKWFEDIVESEGYDYVATAHHANDSVETILLNWTKGNTIDAGIPVKNGKIIRPLLFATRKQLEEYAAQNQVRWREDASNATTDYERNFIRHSVLPLLKELNPALEQTVMRGWDKHAIQHELFEETFRHWQQQFVRHDADKIIIAKQAFEKYSNSASLLWYLIHRLGFHYDTCEKIIEALHGQPGKKFTGVAHELIVDRDAAIVSPIVPLWDAVSIAQQQTHASIGLWNLTIEMISIDEARAELTKPVSPYTAFLDADKISFPLHWRQWQAGDYFFPLGMQQRKKVSDLLVDEKVSLADKSLVTVLESGGEICWVAGHRIDNRFKLTDQTRHVLKLSVSL